MLALKCCQDETDARPSMADVVRELESIRLLAPELDGRTTESFSIETTNKMTPPSSSSEIMNPNMSYDVSGSDLISGVTPTVTPR